MKTCTKCKEVKSKSEFCKEKVKKDGLQSQCKFCCKRHRQENKEQIAARMKVYSDVNKERIVTNSKPHYYANKEKILSRQRVYEKVNAEKISVRKKAYNRNEVNKNRKSVLNKAYRETNKERLTIKNNLYHFANQEQRRQSRREHYVANKEKVNASNKAWSQANPERASIGRNKRRALKLNSEGVYTVSDINILLTTQDSKCVYCQTDLILHGKGKYHVDHIMPLFLGGSNYPENLQLLCPACNLSKGHKHPDIYEKQINHNQNKEL